MSKKPKDIRLKDITGKECMIAQYLEEIDCLDFKNNRSCRHIVPYDEFLQWTEKNRNK